MNGALQRSENPGSGSGRDTGIAQRAPEKTCVLCRKPEKFDTSIGEEEMPFDLPSEGILFDSSFRDAAEARQYLEDLNAVFDSLLADKYLFGEVVAEYAVPPCANDDAIPRARCGGG